MNSSNNTLKYFVETTFNYPTMAEAYRVAALNGMNRLIRRHALLDGLLKRGHHCTTCAANWTDH